MISSYKQLLVWQKSINFVVNIYSVTKLYPKSELFGLVSQTQRSAVAIPSNIAEGHSRGHKKEYSQFLKISYASGAECMTQLIISHKVGYLNNTDCDKLTRDLDEIMKMLYSLIQKIS